MFGKDTYSSVILRSAGPEAAKRMKNYLNNDYSNSVQAFVETEYFANMQETGKQFLFAIIVFAAVMSIGGLFIPEAKESVEMMYEFEKPFVIDSNKFEQTFGMQATPIREAIQETVAWYRSHPEKKKR